jgi:hypothetical protein
MSSLTNEQANERIAATFRNAAVSVVDTAMTALQTGKGPVIENPFSGQTMATPCPPELADLVELVRARGLDKDVAFMRAMATALDYVAGATVFNIACCFDASDDFDGGVHFGIVDPDGRKVDTFVHEILLPLRDKSSGDRAP